jgi:hypothetical protein
MFGCNYEVWNAETPKRLLRAPPSRVWQRPIFAPVWGESVALRAFPFHCIAQANGDTPREPATWTRAVAMLLFSET